MIDALLNGKLGLLVDPGNPEEITSAIKKVINNKSAFKPDEKLLMQNFSYEVYKEKIKKALKIYLQTQHMQKTKYIFNHSSLQLLTYTAHYIIKNKKNKLYKSNNIQSTHKNHTLY